MIDKCYQRNIPSLSEEECALLAEKRICVIGCGGLGGSILEHLARIGVGHITAVDGDVFDESNLNRQILSTEGNLGTLKAEAAKAYIECTNPDCHVEMICQPFSAENASFLKDCDVILDALDSAPFRLLLEDAAEEYSIPLVHGAVNGWSGQVCLVLPGNRTLHRIYQNAALPNNKTVLPFTAAACACMEMSLALKVLIGKSEAEDEALSIFDLFSGQLEKIYLEE